MIVSTHAVSTRALCILARFYVWFVTVEIHIIDDDGGIIDAGLLAAFGALLHFRKPHTSIQNEELIIVC
jgi:exosome complex RNA-binding protein Rrp42 (RNase PH superfamily)